jgi:hypothetical protein
MGISSNDSSNGKDGVINVPQLQPLPSPPRIVLWYTAPLQYWNEKTYAVFFISCITVFFNPHCNVSQDSDEFESTNVTEKEIKQIHGQFGRLLKYFYKENATMKKYYDQFILEEKCNDDNDDNHNKSSPYDIRFNDCYNTDTVAWLDWHPLRVARRTLIKWNDYRKRGSDKGASKEDKMRLYECIINKNVELLQKGLGVPILVSWMLLHYYSAIANTMTLDILNQADEERNEEKRIEEETELTEENKETELDTYCISDVTTCNKTENGDNNVFNEK